VNPGILSQFLGGIALLQDVKASLLKCICRLKKGIHPIHV